MDVSTKDPLILMFIFLAPFILVFGLALTMTYISNDGKSYETRIEERYKIEVLEENNQENGGGYVVYRNAEGQICSADMAENDVLVGSRCGEP